MTVVDPNEPRARRTIWKEALLVAVVVAIVAAVRACDGKQEEGAAAGSGASAIEPGAEAPGPASDVAGALAADRVAADADSATDTPDETPEVRVPVAGPPDGLEVRVVDGENGAPVPGAEVGLASPGSTAPDRSLLWKDPAAARRNATGLYLADEKGVARVPWPGESVERTLVWCVKDGRRACESIGSFTPTPIELRLHAPRSISVRVVDADAAPVACAPVAIGEAGSSGEIDWSDESRTETRADGSTEIRGLELLAPMAAGRRRVVGVPLVAGPVPFVSFDAARPPADPVTLLLPAVGTVRFQVVDGAGRGVPTFGFVGVMHTLAGGYVVSDRQQGAEIRDGVAELRFLPVGFQYYALPRAPRLERDEVWFDGPRANGDIERVELVSGGVGPWLSGRVVDSARVPVGNARLDVQLVGPSGDSLEAVRSDALGHFRADGRWMARDGEQRSLKVIWTRDDGRVSQHGTTALPDRLPDGELDVGDVVLVPRDVLVSGRVVDDRGCAVAGADVQLEFGHPVSEEARASLGPAWWRGAAVVTREDGAFTMFGDREVGGGDLIATISEHPQSSPVRFNPGDRDVEVVLARSGRIVGRLLADQPLDGRGLQLRLRRSELAESEDASTYCIDMADGRFTLGAVPAGSWTLEIVALDGEETELLASVDDVRVLAGEVTRDPRLDPIDLRGRVHVVQVHVVLPDADTKCEPVVRLLAPGAEVPLRVASGPQRDFTFVVTVPEVTVDVCAPRCRRVIRERVRRSATIELVRGTPTPLTIRVGGPEVEGWVAANRESAWLVVFVVPEDTSSLLRLPWLSRVADDGPIRFELPELGRWEVRAHLVAPTDERRLAHPLDLRPLLLDVRDSTPLDVTLPITLDALRAAFDEVASSR